MNKIVNFLNKKEMCILNNLNILDDYDIILNESTLNLNVL
uniref:Uncharacterized protein n=1 Tax=viral metagenome TaxID=1070528 RepID=A0A6C0BAC4_9ZZZZ